MGIGSQILQDMYISSKYEDKPCKLCGKDILFERGFQSWTTKLKHLKTGIVGWDDSFCDSCKAKEVFADITPTKGNEH